jgi:hypothetical protein
LADPFGKPCRGVRAHLGEEEPVPLGRGADPSSWPVCRCAVIR